MFLSLNMRNNLILTKVVINQHRIMQDVSKVVLMVLNRLVITIMGRHLHSPLTNEVSKRP